LLLGSVQVPGQRGALRLSEGFVPGLWQARFIVARRPAALRLPPEPLRVTASLSGPARVFVTTGAGSSVVGLGDEPRDVAILLPRGGRAQLEADATIRLHALRVTRLGGPPWGRLALVLCGGLVGALVARARPRLVGAAFGAAVALLAAGLALCGGFTGLVILALTERLAAFGSLLALAALLLLVRALPSGGIAAAPAWRLPGTCALLALVSCLAQLGSRPQPLLIGDPQAYFEIAGEFARALGAVRGPDSLADALQQLRPYGGLAWLGLLYGLVRLLHEDLVGVYLLHAFASAGAVFFLVRAAARLAPGPAPLLAGTLALALPTLAVLCGLLQPEPVILLLWCFGFDRLLAAREAADLRGFGIAGLAFALGLGLHPQGLWFLLAALGLALAPFAPRLLRPSRRRQLAAFALGLLPVMAGTAAGEAWAKPLAPVLDQRHGFWAYTARMPLGFWLCLETDGWQGPIRIDDTRYARELRQAEREGEVGAGGSLAWTARFVLRNATASTRAVLRNLHRLWDQPDNPPRRDWGLSHRTAVWLYRAVVALVLVGVPLLVSSRAAPLLAPVAMLSATYPLYHIFNKYAVPALPFLLIGAALVIARLGSERPRALLAALAAGAFGAWLAPADLAGLGVPPGPARLLVEMLHLGGLGLALLLAARRWAGDGLARLAAAAAALPLLAAPLAAGWDDPRWRSFHVSLEAGARHEVELPAAARARLDAARQAYLMLDLDLPGGDPRGLRLRFDSGLELDGRALEASMPSFALATRRFGRSPESVPQWWTTPWQAGMADASGRVGLELRGPAPARLRGELQAPGAVTLSLGEWPASSVYRLMHDGEYRLPSRPRLQAVPRHSEAGGHALPGLLGVRLVVLGDAVGGAVWETAAAPPGDVVTAVWARAGRQARAELRLPGGALPLDFEQPQPAAGAPGEVRFVPTGEYEGWFLIRIAASPGGPLRLAVRPFHELSSVPSYFLPEPRDAAPPLPPDWAGLPFAPLAAVHEAREAPEWRPAAVW
jgi:hypothetical protein